MPIEIGNLTNGRPTMTKDGNRYSLRLPGEKKAKARTRVTTFVGAFEDAETLIPWSMVCALVGLSRSTALRARWSALVAKYPDPFYDSPESKTEAKKIAEDAKKAGGAEERRDTGIAVHDLVEAVATGKARLEDIDEEWRPIVTAIFDAITAAGFRVVPELCERTVWNGTYDIVGRFDLTLEEIATGRLVLGDVKTGGELWKPRRESGVQVGWYDAHEINDLQEAMQLAAYVGATHLITWPDMEGRECTVEAPPAWDTERGVIVHAPSTGQEVALRVLDLAVGRAGLEVAKAVSEVRNAKPLVERIGAPAPALCELCATRAHLCATCGDPVPHDEFACAGCLAQVDTPEPVAALPDGDASPPAPDTASTAGRAAEGGAAGGDLAASVQARIKRLAGVNPGALEVVKLQLRNAYGVARGSELDDVQLAEFARWLHGLEQDIPFDEMDTAAVPATPPIALVTTPAPATWTRPEPEEGPPVRRSEVDVIQNAGRAIDGAGKSLLRALLGDMQRAGEPLDLDRKPTMRRYRIAQACVALAEWAVEGEVDEADVRELVVGVLRMDDQPSIPTGRLLAALTIDEASQLATIASGLAEGRGLVWTFEGPRLAAA